MENASKALIMAAGVLIGVLILSLAVYLFFDFASTSSELHEETRLNQVNEFNAQFTSYEVICIHANADRTWLHSCHT